METLKVKKLSELATLPRRATSESAGYDLSSAYDYLIKPRSRELIKNDLAITVPPNTYGRIAPRSGLAWKNRLDVGAGVIDRDFSGNIGVILINSSDQEFEVKRGDRVAQLVIEVIKTPEVEEVNELAETQRAQGSFGSTGK